MCLQLDFVDLDLVMFYADSVKTMGELLLSDKGVQSLDRLLDSCSNVIAAAASPLQHVAAVSYMASVAQVCLKNENLKANWTSFLIQVNSKWGLYVHTASQSSVCLAWHKL